MKRVRGLAVKAGEFVLFVPAAALMALVVAGLNVESWWRARRGEDFK